MLKPNKKPTEAIVQDSQHPADLNPPKPTKPFKSKCIDLTAEYEGLNIGYVGGVQMPKEKSKARN
jgi:hypothetical protein